MTSIRAWFGIAGLLAVTSLSGCSFGQPYFDFPLAVGNQTPNDIRVLVNGRILGDVPAERTLSFTVRLRQTSPNIFANGVAPTPQTRVNLSANDLTLGIAYPGVTAFLTENQSTYVEFHLFCPRDPEQPCVVSSRVV